MRRVPWKEIFVAAGGAILASLAIFLFFKAKMIVDHVDDSIPVSMLRDKQERIGSVVDQHGRDYGQIRDDLVRAVQELDKLRREQLSQPVRGTVSRRTREHRQGENRIYVNTNSDARAFNIDEEVEIQRSGRTIRAFVRGTITNTNEAIIGQLNTDAAEELGITERKGIGEVKLRRLLPESG